MPQNYKAVTKQVSTYRRCTSINIHNPEGGPATVTFKEEEVRVEDGVVVERKPCAALEMVFDPTGSITLLDPASLEPSGETMTQLQVYRGLFAAYMHLARERDEAEEQ